MKFPDEIKISKKNTQQYFNQEFNSFKDQLMEKYEF